MSVNADYIKELGAIFDSPKPNDATVIGTNAAVNGWAGTGIAPFNLDDVQKAMAAWKAQAPPTPPVLTVSSSQYKWLLEAGFLPKEAKWDTSNDNEGLMAVARKQAEAERQDKINKDALLASMEIDPIQDREV